jgi:hypothetical protein
MLLVACQRRRTLAGMMTQCPCRIPIWRDDPDVGSRKVPLIRVAPFRVVTSDGNCINYTGQVLYTGGPVSFRARLVETHNPTKTFYAPTFSMDREDEAKLPQRFIMVRTASRHRRKPWHIANTWNRMGHRGRSRRKTQAMIYTAHIEYVSCLVGKGFMLTLF